MKKVCRLLSLFLPLLLISEIALAEKKKKRKKKRKKQPVGQIVYDSTYHRQGKSFDLVASPVGIAPVTLFSAGLAAGYYINGDLVAEVVVDRGLLPFVFFEIYQNSYVARVKKYWGNSFYTNLGLGSRTIGVKGDSFSTLGEEDSLSFDESTTSFVVDFGIGNKWQFENFTIGCDWIGALIPISSTTNTNLPNDLNEEDRKDLENSWEGIGETTTPYLLKLYLGLSF